MPGPADKMPDLDGREILIAESNALIALDLAETLRGWGARPVLYNELPEAEREAVPDRVFAALVDVSQCHAEQTDLCDALQQRRVPTSPLSSPGRRRRRAMWPGCWPWAFR